MDYESRRLKIKAEGLGDDDKNFTGDTRIYYAYGSKDMVPMYGNILPKGRKFVWRDNLPHSQIDRNNELYDTTFANGRFYIEKRINFFLRRQDPFGKYGLSSPRYERLLKEFANPMDDFIIKGSKQADFTGILYSINNFDNCY